MRNKKVIKSVKSKQRQIPFEGYSNEMPEFDFSSITNEQFDDALNNINLIDPNVKTGRKRKWTQETLIEEVRKYNTLEIFRHEKPYLWTILKHLLILERKKTS
jgi:hypothetical protein